MSREMMTSTMMGAQYGSDDRNWAGTSSCTPEPCLRAHSPGGSAAARLGAVLFIHRCGAALNAHRHFHCCIHDRVFAPARAADGAPGVVFPAASGLAAAAVATVQAPGAPARAARRRPPRGLLAQRAGAQMGGWAHGGGFAVAAAVRIEGADRAGRARLLRYCARPPFALEHWHQHDDLSVLSRREAQHCLHHRAEHRAPDPRAPPLWAATAAAPPAGNAPHWALAAPPLPELAFEQRLAW